jgi:hypothetical protein
MVGGVAASMAAASSAVEIRGDTMVEAFSAVETGGMTAALQP